MENSKYEVNYTWESFCKVGKTTAKTSGEDQLVLEADAEKDGSLEAIDYY